MINLFNMNLVNDECLYKYWAHSYEEDDRTKKVYRPSSFDFPPSFGRDAFEIKKDGEIIFYFPGPDDKRKHLSGQFTIQDQNKLYVDLKTKSVTITVLSCENDRLLIGQD